LIKITSEAFPWERKTYVTYNIAQVAYRNGNQLIGGGFPPYYNTVPVDGDFRETGLTSEGYRGVTATPMLCDSATSPSIGFPTYSDEVRGILEQSAYFGYATTTSEAEAAGGLFAAGPIWNFRAIAWGPVGATDAHNLYLGPVLPVGSIQYRHTAYWQNRVFDSGWYSTPPSDAMDDLIDLPLEGGDGAIWYAASFLAGDGSRPPIVPASGLLLEAARESLSGRAILSTHLFPLCDVNQNGVIDREDESLLAARTLSGVVMY